jgi:hypothetical protein
VTKLSLLSERTTSARLQHGMGMTTVMVIISVALFLGLFAFKVGPNYLENWTVNQVVEEVSAKTDVLKKPRSKVYAQLNKAYRQNNLWDLKAEDTIELKKNKKTGYTLIVKYEKRTNLFANIDVVTTFDSTPEEL